MPCNKRATNPSERRMGGVSNDQRVTDETVIHSLLIAVSGESNLLLWHAHAAQPFQHTIIAA
jgi:hypothetical protein